MNFKPGDVIHCQVTKAHVKQEAGLKLEDRHGQYFILKVGGLFKQRELPIKVGDQLLTFQGEDVEAYGDLNEIKKIMKQDLRIMVSVLRNDPDDSSVSTASQEEPQVLETIEYEDEPVEQYPQLGYYDIRPGDVMRLEGLRGKPELNGEIVTVVEEADKPGRWQVEVQQTGEVISVAADKLVAVGEDEEYESEEEEQEDELLQLENGGTSDVQPGMTMKLFKLKKKAKMNGTQVRIVGPADTPGRWKVKVISTGSIMSIAEDNLKQI